MLDETPDSIETDFVVDEVIEVDEVDDDCVGPVDDQVEEGMEELHPQRHQLMNTQVSPC